MSQNFLDCYSWISCLTAGMNHKLWTMEGCPGFSRQRPDKSTGLVKITLSLKKMKCVQYESQDEWLPAKMLPPWGCTLQTLEVRGDVPKAEKCLSVQHEVAGGRVHQQQATGVPRAGKEETIPGGLNFLLLLHHHPGTPPGWAKFIFSASMGFLCHEVTRRLAWHSPRAEPNNQAMTSTRYSTLLGIFFHYSYPTRKFYYSAE